VTFANRDTRSVGESLTCRCHANADKPIGDRKRPDCSRCSRAKRRCTYESVASRNHTFLEQQNFSPQQTWVPIPTKRRCNHMHVRPELILYTLVDFYHETLDEHGDVAPSEEQGSPHHMSVGFSQREDPLLQIQSTREDDSAEPDQPSSHEQGPPTTSVSNATLRRTECVDVLFGSALEVCLLRHYVGQIAPFVWTSLRL
jgi:hypothetical protein